MKPCVEFTNTLHGEEQRNSGGSKPSIGIGSSSGSSSSSSNGFPRQDSFEKQDISPDIVHSLPEFSKPPRLVPATVVPNNVCSNRKDTTCRPPSSVVSHEEPSEESDSLSCDQHNNNNISPTEHWLDCETDRRRTLVRVTHRNHEGPFKKKMRMSASQHKSSNDGNAQWESLVGALQRHFEYMASGAMVLSTSGHFHGPLGTVPAGPLMGPETTSDATAVVEDTDLQHQEKHHETKLMSNVKAVFDDDVQDAEDLLSTSSPLCHAHNRPFSSHHTKQQVIEIEDGSSSFQQTTTSRDNSQCLTYATTTTNNNNTQEMTPGGEDGELHCDALRMYEEDQQCALF